MVLFKRTPRKKNPVEDLTKKIFPNGIGDIISGQVELKNILEHNISDENARNIFVKSMSIAYLTESFDVERLKVHLDGYCKGAFSEEELALFYRYLIARKAALPYGSSMIRRDRYGNYRLL